MADDDVIDEVDEFDEDLEVDLDEDALDEDALDEDVLDEDVLADDLVVSDDEVFDAEVAGDVDAVDEVVAEPATRARKKVGDEEVEEDEEVVDPDDVEADLDTILKDRIAAADDEEDEEEVEVADTRGPETPDGVTPKKANEFVCTGCFLLVNRGQFGPADQMACPVGESDCPAITVLQKAKK